MSLINCPRCGYLLDVMFARDGAGDDGEVTDVFCDSCGWEDVDPDLGDAVIEP